MKTMETTDPHGPELHGDGADPHGAQAHADLLMRAIGLDGEEKEIPLSRDLSLGLASGRSGCHHVVEGGGSVDIYGIYKEGAVQWASFTKDGIRTMRAIRDKQGAPIEHGALMGSMPAGSPQAWGSYGPAPRRLPAGSGSPHGTAPNMAPEVHAELQGPMSAALPLEIAMLAASSVNVNGPSLPAALERLYGEWMGRAFGCQTHMGNQFCVSDTARAYEDWLRQSARMDEPISRLAYVQPIAANRHPDASLPEDWNMPKEDASSLCAAQDAPRTRTYYEGTARRHGVRTVGELLCIELPHLDMWDKGAYTHNLSAILEARQMGQRTLTAHEGEGTEPVAPVPKGLTVTRLWKNGHEHSRIYAGDGGAVICHMSPFGPIIDDVMGVCIKDVRYDLSGHDDIRGTRAGHCLECCGTGEGDSLGFLMCLMFRGMENLSKMEGCGALYGVIARPDTPDKLLVENRMSAACLSMASCEGGRSFSQMSGIPQMLIRPLSEALCRVEGWCQQDIFLRSAAMLIFRCSLGDSGAPDAAPMRMGAGRGSSMWRMGPLERNATPSMHGCGIGLQDWEEALGILVGICNKFGAHSASMAMSQAGAIKQGRLRPAKELHEILEWLRLNIIETPHAHDMLYNDYIMMLGDSERLRELGFRWDPKGIRAAHDSAAEITSLERGEKEAAQYRERFSERRPSWLHYAYSGSSLSVVVPEDPLDVFIEGAKLRHCVGTYVEAMCSGETAILFIRRNSAAGDPYFTLEVRDGAVRQCHGNCNCGMDSEVRAFLAEWCAGKGVSMMEGENMALGA